MLNKTLSFLLLIYLYYSYTQEENVRLDVWFYNPSDTFNEMVDGIPNGTKAVRMTKATYLSWTKGFSAVKYKLSSKFSGLVQIDISAIR